jgi:hypothetical protein
MKQSKMVIWAIILIFIGLIIFQNQEFFLSKQVMRLNLGVVDVYQSPQVFVAVLFFVFFIFGVILQFLISLPDRFRTNQMLKKLKVINTSLENELADLKRDVAALKGEPVENDKAPEAKVAETAETSLDTPADAGTESSSGDTAADARANPGEASAKIEDSSESADTVSDEKPLADDDTKKDHQADGSTDSSGFKNT